MSGKCEPIRHLKLDDKSAEALKRIKDKKRYANLLPVLMSAGIFSKIFTKSNALQAEYNITQMDWSIYAKAMSSVPATVQRALKTDYFSMITYY